MCVCSKREREDDNKQTTHHQLPWYKIEFHPVCLNRYKSRQLDHILQSEQQKPQNLSPVPNLSFSHWFSHSCSKTCTEKYTFLRRLTYIQWMNPLPKQQTKLSNYICAKTFFEINQVQSIAATKPAKITKKTPNKSKTKLNNDFVLPPFVDSTSWNLQPPLSSDSEEYNSFAACASQDLSGCSAPNLIILYRVSCNFIKGLNACQ